MINVPNLYSNTDCIASLYAKAIADDKFMRWLNTYTHLYLSRAVTVDYYAAYIAGTQANA